MGQDIKITYDIEDGYVGSRPHTFTICPDDFENCDTKEEVKEAIEKAIQEDFEQNVSWVCNCVPSAIAATWRRVQEIRAETEQE
jgi:hypothetical protein